MSEVELRDAATVLILRDGPPDADGDALEVFMLRRNLDSDFVGGAFVFPGGAVDPEDRHDDLDAVCRGRSDADASARLGIEQGGLAFWVAAIRESFEEAGVLLAYHPDGEVIRLADPETNERFAAHRTAVDSGQRRLVEICEEEGLELAVDAIWYFGHWITPVGAPRRYDTRFFVTLAPPAQTPVHDDHEVIANLWIKPKAALARHGDGDFQMLPPTIASLRAVSRFSTAAEVLEAAAELTDVPTILPRVILDEGGVRIVLPGDPEYGEGYTGEEPLGRWPSVDERSRLAITLQGEPGADRGRDGPRD
jgi:8-oxo-dGTP pyrophosphatase MutT (NUDIX family)